MKKLTVLGSTGSIGVSTLDVCARHPDRYRIVALTANSDVDVLYQQCLQFHPSYAVMANEQAASRLRQRFAGQADKPEVLAGARGLEQVAALEEVDAVMAAIVGAAGLLPALAAVRAGKQLLLANKEALVLAGHLFISEAKKHQARILPIDSEHNAIFQCMPSDYADGLETVGVTRILLTASGGPFLNTSLQELSNVTPEQAVAHPNWDMGRKISVDSATMMNKGLEVIEARWLFDAAPDRIQVVVHPQSVIHSMVEYNDGSVLAQMGNPDMRTPIAHALAWPERIESGVEKLDLFKVGRLDFFSPDFERFPCLRLAFDALSEADSATAILNAANEVAVQAFLDRRLSFRGIAHVNEAVLSHLPAINTTSIDELLDIDQNARDLAEQQIRDRMQA
ncbi:MAG: 1-deoxy-D-xylulose-5-phosphate reductoisomerase [Chromatiales bacterium]|jgi:1-deoxy-D-xylulose-5-phosphate reductoisomerase